MSEKNVNYTAGEAHEKIRQRIKKLLNQQLTVGVLEVLNNSHLHVGHAGAKEGGGHFAVKISAQELDGLSRIKQHQCIYKILNELMSQQLIHALEIETHRFSN